MSKNRPDLSPERIIKIYKEMRWWRQMYFKDNPLEKKEGIINGAKFWEWYADENAEVVKIRFDRYLDSIKNRVAFVVKLDPLTVLNVSKKKLEEAKKNVGFSNFVLAHEFAHVALEHSNSTTAPLPFSLHEEDGVLMASVDDVIELEAHYGAIFLQVGAKLFEAGVNTSVLARQAGTDYYRLNKLYKVCQLEIVQTGFERSKQIRRVIL